MRIRTENAKWIVFCMVPQITLYLLAMVACLVGWDWLEDRCDQWIQELNPPKIP